MTDSNRKASPTTGTSGLLASDQADALPAPETTVFNYDPITVHGRTAYLAGQIPKRDGSLAYCGLVGDSLSIEDAKKASRICAQQALAWVHKCAGGLDNVERVLRIDCFVAHADGFAQISDIADSASSLLIEYLGEAGRHSRSVIGVKSLPRNAPVLIEMTMALRKEIS